MDTAGESPAKRVKRKLIVAGGVRQHRRNVIRGTSGTILVRLHMRGELRIMEQQLGVLIQQVMEMTGRLRQKEESAEQVRHGVDKERKVTKSFKETWASPSTKETCVGPLSLTPRKASLFSKNKSNE